MVTGPWQVMRRASGSGLDHWLRLLTQSGCRLLFFALRNSSLHPDCAGGLYLEPVYSTQVTRHVRAPRSVVYRALLDPTAIANWRVPAGMTSHVHDFNAHEGGLFRISLTYDAPSETGKSSPHTDTYHGHFVRLVPDEQVVEIFEFETSDVKLHGRMTMTTTLTDADGGTDVRIVHEGVPDGVPAGNNEAGTRMALANLARLVEGINASG
jgi:uncharacterized protein YndB with AHSA1/START domain